MSDAQQQAAELKKVGNEHFLKGEHQKAIKAFTEAISLDSSNHVLYSNRAASYTSLREFAKALSDAEKTIELDPSFLKGYVRKAVALFYLKRFEEAELAYKHLIELDPSNASHTTGLHQSKIGVAVAKAIPDGCWGQLVAPFASQAPHGIKFEAVGPACTWLFDKGAVGVISVGPAAEMNKLSQQERIDLAKAAATHFGAKCRTVCFADVSSKDLAAHVTALSNTGAAAVVLPLVAPFYDKSVSAKELSKRLSDLCDKIPEHVILGLAEMSPTLTLTPETLAAACSAAPGHLGFFIDRSPSPSQIQAKKEILPPNVKLFASTLTSLLEPFSIGANGFMGNASAFFPHLIQWVFLHHQSKVDLNQQRSQMIQRFLSIADLAVQRFFPLNAKMYLRITNDPAFEMLDIVTRQSQNQDDAPGEEDIVRLAHLNELVHYVTDSLKEEEKGAGSRRDASLLL